MSHSFYVDLDDAPTYDDVLGQFSPPLETTAGYADDLEGSWQAGHVVAVWRDGVSTRPVELCWEKGRFSARILACSCPEDYAIALDAVCGVASAEDREVVSEEGIRFDPDARDASHGDAWILSHVDSMVQTILRHAREASPGSWAAMAGPTRSFHIGPRLAAELGVGDAAAQREALFSKMRALLYPDPESVYAANTLAVTLADGSRVTTSALAPDVPYIFPPVDYLTILDDEPFEIPFTALGEVVGEDALTYVDEACPRIPAVAPDAWPDFVARARAHAVAPLGEGPSTPGERVSHAPAAPVARVEPTQGVPWGLIVGATLGLLALLYALWR